MKTIRTAVLVSAMIFTHFAFAVPAEGHKLMVSGPSPYAVQTARRIGAKGGNVVDVAVAVALTLSVTSPYYAALGGGGFALVKMDGPVQVLDFRETAPAASNRDYFKDQPEQSSRLFPHVIDPKTARQQLRREVRVVDPQAVCCGRGVGQSPVPWTVTG